MDKMQKDMLAKATAARNANVATVLEWKDFTPALNEKKMVLTPWCEDPESEDEAKAARTDGSSLWIPATPQLLRLRRRCHRAGRGSRWEVVAHT